MIDAKLAVQIAREKAADVLDRNAHGLEEIERETYKDRDTWSITLSFPRDLTNMTPLASLAADPLVYKRILIDAETGELIAIKLREVASR